MPAAPLIVAGAYLIGSVSFAVVVSRAFGLPDPRDYGSGNPGATNVLRSGNKLAAVLTLLGDAAKGWLAVFLVQQFGPAYGAQPQDAAIAGFAAFFGHLHPIFLNFKGGKGVATAAGVMFGFSLWLGLGVLAVWIGVVWGCLCLARPRLRMASRRTPVSGTGRGEESREGAAGNLLSA